MPEPIAAAKVVSLAPNDTEQAKSPQRDNYPPDANEKRNRLRAAGRHIERFNGQMAVSILAIALVAATPVFRAFVNDIFRRSAADTGLIALTLLPSLVLLVGLVWLLWYWREQGIDWRLAGEQSTVRTPDVCARGYLSTFLIYTRTKHTAFFTRLFGAAAVYSAAFGIFSANGAPIPIGIAVTEILLAGALIWVGFEIGRDFVPGRTLVENTLIMSYLATTSQTNYTTAQKDAQHLLAGIRDERPWSFYSFRRVRGSAQR